MTEQAAEDSPQEGHSFSVNSLSCVSPGLKSPGEKPWTSEAAEKPELFEGDGLQAVHNCFVVSAALSRRGSGFSSTETFSAASSVQGQTRENALSCTTRLYPG